MVEVLVSNTKAKHDEHPGVARDYVDRYSTEAIRNSGQALVALCRIDDLTTPLEINRELNIAENYAHHLLRCVKETRKGLKL